jgi:hypothetical protein
MTQPLPNRRGLTRLATSAVVLLSLFLVVAAVVLLVRYLRPAPYTVTALFDVSSERPDVLENHPPLDERENKLFRATQIAYLKSYFVIQEALGEPGLAALAVLAPQKDKVVWLRDNLDISYMDDDSEILQIQLHGTEDQAEELRRLVDALCDSYQKHVLFADEQRRLVVHDATSRASDRLRKKITSLIQDRNKLKEQSPPDPAAVEVLQSEIDELTSLWRGILRKSELDELNQATPDRIRLIQKATVTSDDDPLVH